MAFNILHNIKSKLAEENNINNFPGVDVNSNPTLTYNFIKNFYNIIFFFRNCYTYYKYFMFFINLFIKKK